MRWEMNNNIEESCCSDEVRAILYSKGFRFVERSRTKSHTSLSVKMSLFNSGDELSAAISHALAIEWIRVNFGIFISTEFNNTNLMYYYVIHTNVGKHSKHSNRINSLPESFLEPFLATEVALLHTIQNLIK